MLPKVFVYSDKAINDGKMDIILSNRSNMDKRTKRGKKYKDKTKVSISESHSTDFIFNDNWTLHCIQVDLNPNPKL